MLKSKKLNIAILIVAVIIFLVLIYDLFTGNGNTVILGIFTVVLLMVTQIVSIKNK